MSIAALAGRAASANRTHQICPSSGVDLLRTLMLTLLTLFTGDSQEAEDVRSLISRMLTKHPMQRPVVDIVVQDAIAKLYVEHDLEPEASPPPSPMSPARCKVSLWLVIT